MFAKTRLLTRAAVSGSACRPRRDRAMGRGRQPGRHLRFQRHPLRRRAHPVPDLRRALRRTSGLGDDAGRLRPAPARPQRPRDRREGAGDCRGRRAGRSAAGVAQAPLSRTGRARQSDRRRHRRPGGRAGRPRRADGDRHRRAARRRPRGPGGQPGRGGDHRRRRRGGRPPWQARPGGFPRRRRAARARADRRAGIRGLGARDTGALAAGMRCIAVGTAPGDEVRAVAPAVVPGLSTGLLDAVLPRLRNRGRRAGDGDTGPAQRPVRCPAGRFWDNRRQ